MARHDGNIGDDARRALTVEELAALLRDVSPREHEVRQDAIARYLAGGEGCDDAGKLLGGAFATEVTGLKVRKDV